MADNRFDDGVTMGRLSNPQHTDNALRVYSSRPDKTTIQLRMQTWYLCRDLSRDEVIELIRVLATELSPPAKALEEAS